MDREAFFQARRMASARTIEKRFLREAGTAWWSGHAYRRGRLPPGALKRVQQYVEDHLGERVSTERLAAIAGLYPSFISLAPSSNRKA